MEIFLEPLLIDMFGAGVFWPGLIAYAIINVSTIYYDEKELNKAKIKINNALIWGAILVFFKRLRHE